MCGIVGFVDPGGRTPEPARVLRAMRDALTHRGPDDAGEHLAPPIYLGHRRLAIVDPSPAGHQPLAAFPEGPGRPAERDGEGIYAVVNGEIYNHESLRPLVRARYTDAAIARTDSGVVPWLWATLGPDFPRVLSGMYALAVWDTGARRLLLARDLAGQKPLYYAPLPGGGLAFASEPKALLLHPLVGRTLDPLAIRRYATYDYVPGEATVYRQIRRLPPNSALDWQDGRWSTRRLHAPPLGDPWATSLEEAAQALWTRVADAVEARLMADVPLGVFLSGGLDSTALVAALAERTDPRRVKTFSIGFADPTFDESSHARVVARHFGTDHRERRLDTATMLRLLPEILRTLDEPFADGSLVPTYLLAAFAREEVTVALGGEGGDELLMGYPTFLGDVAARLAARLPRRLLTHALQPLVARLPVSLDYLSLDFRLKRFLYALDLPADHRHPVWVGGLHPRDHAAALAPWILADAPDDALFADLDDLAARFARAGRRGDHLARIAWEYFGTYLADSVLTKVDRASMAHALEVRAPLLDASVVHFAMRLPTRLRFRAPRTKRVLRRALRGRVPDEVLRWPKKGFGFPIGRWLRGPLTPWLRETLEHDRVARGGLLNPAWTDRLVAEHTAGRANHRKALWSALVLELWRRGPYGPGT